MRLAKFVLPILLGSLAMVGCDSGASTSTSDVIHVNNVKFEVSSLSLNVGDTESIGYIISPINASNKSVTFSSSNESVATIDSTGLIHALAVGQTTLTVTTVDRNKIATALLTVKDSSTNSGNSGNTGNTGDNTGGSTGGNTGGNTGGDNPTTPKDTSVKDKRNKTYYQLLVYSFADGDGKDGIGDFKGIVDKLDYLENLGVEGIWLSPILECKSYHAYDVTNYYKINPDYEVTVSGKKYDYKCLLEECHKRGISVLMDLVLNHTSTSHDWYKNHRDWYSGKNVFGDSMPDLDYNNTTVQDAVIEVGKHWLNEGFDGYRLDAAMWLYNAQGGTNASSVDHNKNYEYWTKWCSEMKKVKSDAYIIGEVLNYNHDYAFQYAQAGFDSTFNFNVRTQVENLINNPSYDYVTNYNNDLAKAKQYNSNYILGRPLSNHDVGRFTCYHPGMSDESAHYVTTFNDIRLANAINVLTPGNAFIYYGDELGLTGTCEQGWDDMAYRTPMPFGSERTDSALYFQGFKGNGKTSSNSLSGKTAEQDMENNASLYTSLSQLINIKKNHNAINAGTMSKISDLPSGLNGFKLSDDSEEVYVIYNTSGSSKNYTIPNGMSLLYATEAASDGSVQLTNKGFLVCQK